MEGKVSPCFKCGKDIAQVPYKYDGMTFHARCLRCNTCDKKLAGKPFIVASRGIFCGEQCKLSFTEQQPSSVSKTPPSSEQQGRDRATSPELITDFEALQSISQEGQRRASSQEAQRRASSQEAQRRASSPLFYPERVTDYPTSHSLANLKLSQSPTTHHRLSSLSPVPDTHHSSNSTLNRSDSLSAVSETSGTSDTSKPAQKRILKKSNGPRRSSTNHVRWNLDGVERSTDDGDSTSMDSVEASWSGDPYRQAKERFQRSRSAWKDFEAPPLAGNTGLTPAPPKVAKQKTMFHPDDIPLSPIRREAPVKFPGCYELGSQIPTNMGTSHSTPLRNTGVQELYEDEGMGTNEDNAPASETVAAGFSVLKINDSSLASLEVTRADERLGTCMFEFPKETPLSAPFTSTTIPSVAVPHPPSSMATSSAATGSIPVLKGNPLVGRGTPSSGGAKSGVMGTIGAGATGVMGTIGAGATGVMGTIGAGAIGVMGTRGAGATGVISSSDTNAGVNMSPAQIPRAPQIMLNDDDASDYDHLEEKTSNQPSRAPNRTSNPPSKTSGPSNVSGALSKVPSGHPDPSSGLPATTSSLPNTTITPPSLITASGPSLITASGPSLITASGPSLITASGPSLITASGPSLITASGPSLITASGPSLITASGPSLLAATSIPKREQASVQSSHSEQDIEEAIEVLEYEMNALDRKTIPLTTPTVGTGTVSAAVAQGFHSASEITKVWRSTFPEPQSAQPSVENHHTSDQTLPTHHPQANQSPSPPPLPAKNRRVSRSDRDEEGNLLPNLSSKKEEGVQLNQWHDTAVMGHVHSQYLPPVTQYLPPITEISSLTLPEGEGGELILPPPSEFLDIPPHSKDNDRDDYFDLLEPNASKALQHTTSNPLKVAPGRPVDRPPAVGSSGIPDDIMRDGLLGGGPLQKGTPLYREDPLIGAHHDPHPVQRVQSSRVTSTSSKLNELESEGSNSGQVLSVHGAGQGKLTTTRALHMSDSESSLNDALRGAKGRYGGAPIGAQHTQPPLFQPFQVTNSRADLKRLPNQLERPSQGERQLRRTSSQAPMPSSSQPLVHSSTQATFHSSSQSLVHSSSQVPMHSSSQVPMHSSSQVPMHSSSQVPMHSSSQVPMHSSSQVPMHSSSQVPMHSSSQVPMHSSSQVPMHSSSQVPMHSSSQPLVHPSSQPPAYPVPLLNSKFNPMRHKGQNSVTGVDGMITELERDCKRNIQETRAHPVCAACGKPITNFPINHDKSSYHSKCYHCVQCGCSLVDKAFSRTRNGLCCKEHLPGPCISSTTPSQTRRTDHQTGYPGHTHYHQSLSGGSVTSV